jgi:hypothetical protein
MTAHQIANHRRVMALPIGRCVSDDQGEKQHRICAACETVLWCSANGCIPLQDIGVESALPAAFTADPPKPPRAIDWQAVFIYGAAFIVFTAVIALSVYQP